MSNKPETKKLKKLTVKKETITDLDPQNTDQVKGGKASDYFCTVGCSETLQCSNTCATHCPPYCIKAR